MLRFLQGELPKLWKEELYSNQFRQSPSRYKDFQHGLIHVEKAIGHLWEMIEEADHSASDDSTVHFPKEDVAKYLADAVICTLRMAVKNPSGAVDLESAVFDRIEEKMGARLDPVEGGA